MMYRASPVEAPILVAAGNGLVHGRDRASGRVVWQFAFCPPGVHPFVDVMLAMTGEHVVASAGIGLRDTVHALVCLDYLTGRVRWNVRAADQVQMLLLSGEQIFVTTEGSLSSFALEDGRLLWFEPLAGGRQVGLGVPGAVVRREP